MPTRRGKVVVGMVLLIRAAYRDLKVRHIVQCLWFAPSKILRRSYALSTARAVLKNCQRIHDRLWATSFLVQEDCRSA
ncbi:hypothetical protein EDC04DRAFT_2766668 [Pisolithus marmoratus]|nr:hypothetical protein EDC04DRAFT_2766668 [Pisolithus marmoratus]